ncbi:hypothetical protein FQR65_LT19525 [Abscondita terminalis]|nr:hypothetical protein FQR65_LT19525 [Abscondita terminalis]
MSISYYALSSGVGKHFTNASPVQVLQVIQARFRGTGGIDNSDGRVIRFQLKGIFKPKHGEPDVRKAGQGISVDACAMFCSIFRILTRLVVKTECPHVLTDAYMAESVTYCCDYEQLKEFSDRENLHHGRINSTQSERFHTTTERSMAPAPADGVPEDSLDHYIRSEQIY